jgi:hypothetical protein
MLSKTASNSKIIFDEVCQHLEDMCFPNDQHIFQENIYGYHLFKAQKTMDFNVR